MNPSPVEASRQSLELGVGQRHRRAEALQAVDFLGDGDKMSESKTIQQILKARVHKHNARGKRVRLDMQRQERTYWCWAATSVSVVRFFDPASHWTQRSVAYEVLGENCSEDCTEGCPHDEVACLDEALERVSCLSRMSTGVDGPKTVKGEIDAGRPLCMRIQWKSGGGHFLAIVGWFLAADRGTVYIVEDPAYGRTRIASSDIVTRYREIGRWTHSYFVTTPTLYDPEANNLIDKDPEAVGG